jgi:non-ribosomal peptide synthetase component E (peptide arylation enzyme)
MDAQQVADSVVEYAAQTGRLDFISAVLASLAFLLAIGALPVFLLLRYRAAEIAREAAESELKKISANMERMAVERLEAMLPSLVAEYVALAQSAVSAEAANSIAAFEAGQFDENNGGNQAGSATSPGQSG